MVRTILAAIAAAFFLAVSAPAFADADSGTAADAKALLEKAIAAIKSDEKKAIDDFNNPSGGFRDRDLYVFCAAAPAYNFTAHPKESLRGTPLAALVDKKGKKLGEALIAAATEGKIAEVEYFYPRPGGTDPVEKVTFVTKVGGEVCGVGYYK
jgi:signal transduction histidine kinase